MSAMAATNEPHPDTIAVGCMTWRRMLVPMTDRRWWVVIAVALLAVALVAGLGGPRSKAGLAASSPTARPTASPTPSASSTPWVSSSPAVSAGIPVSPSPSAVACAATDQDQYVYNPARLEVAAPCIRVTGLVAEVRTEADGDLHMLLALDAAYAHLLTPANQGVERGDLVVEPVCVRSVTQLDAIEACAADPDPLSLLPRQGDYVWMEGRYVFDLQHGGWAELHPLYRWGYQAGAPLAGGSPTPAFSPTGCDPSYPTVCIPPPPPDLDCADIPYRRFTVLPPDPHHFDGDHDGIGCES